jgi:hypothetical protein
VLRPAHQLFVFCSETCRRAFRAGRKRLIRNFRGVRAHPGDEIWNLGAPSVETVPARGPPLDGNSARDTLARDELDA